MYIEKIKDDKRLTVKIKGRLDTKTAPELNESLQNDLTGIDELILDLSELNYISSAGLRVILATQKIMNTQGTMTVCNVQEIVMEVFEATGFRDILTIK